MSKCTKQQWGKDESLGQVPRVSLLNHKPQHLEHHTDKL